MNVYIDWSQMVTAEMKEAQKQEAILAAVKAEQARLRKIADDVIAPLQDASDMGEASPEDEAALLAWKRYRIALTKINTLPGYPNDFAWPVSPDPEVTA